MSYVMINRACDGTHVTVYETEAAALAALGEMVGRRSEPFVINRSYVSDWGNACTVEQRPDGWSAETEDAIREAFDARECGVETPEQVALLDRYGF